MRRASVSIWATSAALLLSFPNIAQAQRYETESRCQDLVTGTCIQYWQEAGWASYQDCYDANMNYCEGAGDGSGDGGGWIVLPGEIVCRSVGTGSISGC
jgi:hypothetical protein